MRMASTRPFARSAVPRLMTTVKRLTPAELREFKRRFAVWQQKNGGKAAAEAALVQACKVRLPAVEERQLEKLIARSERGVLSRDQLEEYRALVRRVEQLDATRLAALTQLARRWGKTVHFVMETIGWEGGGDETTGHPARPTKAGARSRR
jgi:hypothetical protein